MIVGMALDAEGRPICCEMWPGNTADVTTLLPVVKRMRERFRIREITVVADRGMVSQATLEAFENSDPPVRYIVGVRMRRQKEVSISVLGSRARWFESVPQRSKAKDPAPLKVKEVWVEDRRYIVCLNEEERRKDAHDREAIVAHLKEQLLERSTKAWSATRDTAAISKSKEAATLSSMKNRSKPKSATTGFGYCGLTLFIMPRP
jgi:transposase